MAKGTVNKVIILGRLGQDPEVRATAGGTQVVNLNVATNELGPKDDNGSRQDLTEWHRCVLFGRTAEIAAQYLRKGSLVYLEGRIQTRKWQDQTGNDRYSTEIVANEMQLMGGGRDNNAAPGGFAPQSQNAPGGYSNSPQQQQPQGGYNQQAPQQQQGGYQQPAQKPAAPQSPPMQAFEDFDDDIPF